MFKRQPTDIQLFVTLVLVLAMGIPTFQALAEPDDIQGYGVVTGAVPSAQRQPSSIAKVSVPNGQPSLPSSFTKHDLNCVKKSPVEVQIKGEIVQLQGRSCLGDFSAGEVEIVNKSNGYTASVFDNGPDKYQTDLIQLQNGSNEISIRYRDASGKTIEEVLKIHSQQL